MAYSVSDLTITPSAVAVSSGFTISVPDAVAAFNLDFAVIAGEVTFLGYQNAPAGRPASGQLWPRGDGLT